jgi:cyclic pyranopterin phosphate synthase
LYGKHVANLRDLVRGESNTEKVKETILNAIGNRAKTGFEAQEKHAQTVFDSSMTSIGG